MRKFLRKLLSIDQSEEGRVYMLLINSFFLGAFVVTFDVTVSTLFIDQLDKIEAYAVLKRDNLSWLWRDVIYKYPLPVSIIVTGFLGIVATAIFSTLQNIVSFSRLTIVNLLIILLLVSTITLAYRYIDPNNFSQYYPLLLISFACLGPFNAIALLGFYGTVSRAFNLKQEKRIMGTVDQGGMFATSIAFFAVPIINFTEPKSYLYISAVGVFVSLITQIVFNLKFSSFRTVQPTTITNNSGSSQADSKLNSLIKNKYVRLLSVMFMLSVVANIFVDYSFLKSSSFTFPVTNDLTNFLAYYGGILTVISLLMQVFIGDNIIEQYGVKVSLLVLPILVAFFTLLAGLMGLFSDSAISSGNNLMFFVFIALSKLFFSVAKDTFEDPILKNFFIPLDISIRHDVQAKVEGVFRQFSWALAGVAIFAFGLITFINLEHYSFLLLVICVIYMFASFRLFDSYQFTLLDSLNLQKSKLSTSKKEYSPISVMKKELQSNEPDKVIYTLKLMERIEPVLLENSSNELVYDPSEEIRKYAIRIIDDCKSLPAASTLKNVIKLEDSEEVKKLANEALDKLNDAEIIALSKNKLYKLAKSTDVQERLLAAKLIYRSIDDTNIQMLLDLMRDRDLKVRAAAIISAGKTGRSEYWPLMIENLNSPLFGNTAAASIYSIGEKVLPALESAFYKSGQSTEVMVKIVQMYGRFGGSEVTEYLWSKIDFPDKNVTSQVLLSLSGCAFQAEGHKATRIIQAIELEIGNSAWCIAAYTELGDDEDVRYLKKAIIEEIESTDNKIFMLLSLVYDPNSIQLVRQNIESRTSEGIVYAIELLNVFIADELKPVLFPLLDEISIQEKIMKLQEHYFREKFDKNQVLIEIINRDYNYIGRWTKACALYRYCKMSGAKVTDDLVANLFNPDSLLRETAAYAIYKLDKEAYHRYTKRLGEQKKELDSVILAQERIGNNKQLQIEKVLVLKDVKSFASIHGVFLSGIADNIEEVFYKKGDYILKKGDTGNIPLYVIVEGTLEVKEGANVIARMVKGDLVGEALVLESDVNPNDVIAYDNVTLYAIGKEHFYEMMSQSHEMTEGVIAGFVEHTVLEEKDNLVESLEDTNKI